MPSATNVQTRLIQRIVNSGLTLTVVYPPVRAVASGTSPGVAPVNPLTGPAPADGVFIAEPAGYSANVTLKCLWLDALTGREAADAANTELIRMTPAGWVRGATSMARVLVSEAALDPANPYGGTILDAADHLLYRGARFRVLQVTPVSCGFSVPVSYHVWLVGERIN